MSFSQSDLTSGNFNSVALSGTNGIAGSSSNLGIYYTTNAGQNWTRSIDASGNFFSGNFYSVVLSGANGIAGSASRSGIWYTTDVGQTWTQSNVTSGDFYSVALSGTNGIAGSSSNLGIYYTTNSGQTWTQSNFTSGYFYSVALSGTNGIAGSASNLGIYYTTDAGQTWRQSNVTLGVNKSAALSGTIGIAGLYDPYNTSFGIYYTTDAGQTWTQSNLTSGILTVALSGTNGIAGSYNFVGIFYTTDAGQTWTRSKDASGNFFLGDFNSVALSGANGIASSNGIWYTIDAGKTWTRSNVSSGNYNSVAISGINGIAGSADNAGIYYSSSPICYGENTLILILENNEEVYKKISELKVGDLVKTYKNGYKTIKFINSIQYKPIDESGPLYYLYKMKDHDIILTGGHSILVDVLTEEEHEKNIVFGVNESIEDKKLLLACSSDKFVKIEDNEEYDLYHLVLENNGLLGRYGIYITDGILSETCSEFMYLQKFPKDYSFNMPAHITEMKEF